VPRTAVVVGAGPGLGMSIAHRLGRQGHTVALLSRGAARHADYLARLKQAGIEAEAHVADVLDTEQTLKALDTVAERHGGIDVLYYGPGAVDPADAPKPILGTGRADVEAAMAAYVHPAIEVTNRVLPAMIERGSGGLLFAGGVSAVVPMPFLGALTISSAALRQWAVTLNAALADTGVYAGVLTIGGLIRRGDIHAYVRSHPEKFGGVVAELDPDEIADTAWRLLSERDRPEAVFNVLG
jgi:NAD(P)-dependent dehydrogenase (short-subunit alcohol dehydrogenase family)